MRVPEPSRQKKNSSPLIFLQLARGPKSPILPQNRPPLPPWRPYASPDPRNRLPSSLATSRYEYLPGRRTLTYERRRAANSKCAIFHYFIFRCGLTSLTSGHRIATKAEKTLVSSASKTWILFDLLGLIFPAVSLTISLRLLPLQPC